MEKGGKIPKGRATCPDFPGIAPSREDNGEGKCPIKGGDRPPGTGR